MATRKTLVVYPVKIGYSDGDGVIELDITDANDNAVIRGERGEYGPTFDNKETADVIVDLLNKNKPELFISKYIDN